MNGIEGLEEFDMDDYVPVFPKPEDYYDLIELPDGHHVPVPIAKNLIGWTIIESIPVSRKQRDGRFFYCAQCDQYQTMIDKMAFSKLLMPLENGYSFYRCKTHKPYCKEENQAKESMLVRLVLGGLYKTLRYVEAVR